MQERTYKDFCTKYGRAWRDPDEATLILFITYLVGKFSSASSVRNYYSGVRFLFRRLGLQPPALDSPHVGWQLRAADLTMRTPASPKLPITPQLLKCLCLLCPGLGQLGPAMKVALTFGFFGMVRQSNLAPSTHGDFDCTRHTCRGDIFRAPPGLIVYVKWSKTQQMAEHSNMLPLPDLKGHPADPVEAFRQLESASPSSSSMQPLLTCPSPRGPVTVTTPQLASALKDMLESLGLRACLYSLHSLRRGGCTTAYTQDVPVVDVRRHGCWNSDAFWGYISAPTAANSKVAKALRKVVAKTDG